MRAKTKNNLVFKETCGLWKHKTSFEDLDLCKKDLLQVRKFYANEIYAS